MLSKKSFGGNKRNFLNLLMRFVRNNVSDHIGKRPRTFLATLKSCAAAMKSKDQLSRDFWG
jgi:hypothetical protein